MRSTDSRIVGSYQRLYAAHGYAPRSLGWDKGKQFLRFHQLSSKWDLSGATILDVGCGFGDFVDYLRVREIDVASYVGIDLVGEFIAEADRRFGSSRASFVRVALDDFEPASSFDFVIASGTFNLKVEGLDGYENVRRSLGRMFSLANVAIAADFLSDKVEYAYEHNFVSAPERILAMAYELSRRVALTNTYFPFEFCVSIYKDDSFNRETTTFGEIERTLASLRN